MSDTRTCRDCERIVDLSHTKGGACDACGVLCGTCADGHGRCDVCGEFSCSDAVERMGFLLMDQRICEACVTKEAKDSAPTSHEFLVMLAAFLADQGYKAEDLAAAVEKPWKWKDEWALAVLSNRVAHEKRSRAEADKVAAFAQRNLALDAAKPQLRVLS